MMKQTVILVLALIFGFLSLLTANDIELPIDATEATCPCNCNPAQDLQVLQDLYNNNGGVNWTLPSNGVYQDLLQQGQFFPVPNSGNTWNVNDPNAVNLMGTWHGVTTNAAGCVTEVILWSGPYNEANQYNFLPQGVGVTGSLPSSIGDLCALEKLMIPHNNLTGSIPSTIEDLCGLKFLLLHNNDLSGPLPPEIGNLTNLVHLGLHYNGFTGTLPTSFTNLTEAIIFHIKANKLTGPIPANIGNLDKILLMDLSENCFSGTVPPSIVNLGRNSVDGGVFRGVLYALWLQDNKLDSLPNITGISLVNNHLLDVSGNHFTFDDIIPNVGVLTKYDDQTLDLNQVFCAEIGDTLVIVPGFDQSIDARMYGDTSIYVWSRASDNFMTQSGLNRITFTGTSLFSAGNFSMSITNVQAPDMTLTVSNLIVEVVADPVLDGAVELCAGTEETYTINDGNGYDFSMTGGTTVAMDSTSITVLWNNNPTGQICAVGRTTCSTTTCYDITITPPITVSILPPDTLDCTKTNATLIGNVNNNAGLNFSWLTTLDSLDVDSLLVTEPGDYILVGANDIGCEGRDTVSVIEQIDDFQVDIMGVDRFCNGSSTNLEVAPNYDNYSWNTGATSRSITASNPGMYEVTVTNANGCTSFSSVEVRELLPPPVFISKSGDLDCSNDIVELASSNLASTATFQWRDTSGNILGSDSVLTVTNPGMYTLVTTSEFGCVSDAQLEVLEDNTVIIPQILGATTFCEGTTAELEVNTTYASYLWSNGATTPTIQVNAEATYSVTVTDNTGCSGSNTIELQTQPLPAINIQGDTEICKAEQTILSVDSTFTSIVWSNGVTTFDNVISTPNTYTVTVTNGNNCTNTASITVTEASTIQATIAGEPNFCKGTGTSLFGSPNGSSATYEWSTGETSLFVIVDSAGMYGLTITDEKGCTSEASANITELPLPSINFSGTATICSGNSTSINVDEFYPAYQWSSGDNTQNVQISAPGTYSLTVTDANQCRDTSSIEVVELPNLSPTILGTLFLCSDGTTSLQAGETYNNYLWSTGETTASIAVNSVATYTLTVTDIGGCTGTTSVTIDPAANPTPSVIGSATLCTGTTSKLTTEKDYATYQWSSGETTETITINTAGEYLVTVTTSRGCEGIGRLVVTDAPDIQFNIVGNSAICAGASTVLQADADYLAYNWSTGEVTPNIEVNQIGTYSLTVTDQSGCVGNASITVIENSSIFPQIIGTPTICGGGTTIISADSDYASYSWSNGATSKDITINSAGDYKVTVSNTAGCTGEATINIGQAVALQPQIEGSLSFCEGQTTTLSLDTTYSSYLWTGGIVRSSIEVGAAGVYAVTVTDAAGCTGEVAVPIQEGILSPPAITPGDTTICAGDVIGLSVESGFDSYEWNTGDSTQFIFSQSEQLFYSLTVTDENGCKGISTITISQLARPNLAEGEPKTLCKGDSISEKLSLFGFDTYLWSTGATTPEISVMTEGTYSLTVTDDNGCTGTTFYKVTEEEPPALNIINNSKKDTLDCSDEPLLLVDIGSQVDSYQWFDEDNNVIGNLRLLQITKGGTYKVIGKSSSSNCVSEFETTIVEFENNVELILKDSLRTLSCQDTSINLDLSGSTADVFNWTFFTEDGFQKDLVNVTGNSYNVDEPGDYLIVGTDSRSACGASIRVTITDERETLNPVVDTGGSLCKGSDDPIRLSVREADTYQSYSWFDGSTSESTQVMQEGYYEVRVTDENGCKGVGAIRIEAKDRTELEAFLKSDNTQICKGTEATIQLIVESGGIGPYDFILSDGINDEITVGVEGSTENFSITMPEGKTFTIEDVIDYGNNCYNVSMVEPMITFNVLDLPSVESKRFPECTDQDSRGAAFKLEDIADEVRENTSHSIRWYTDTTHMNQIETPVYRTTTNAATVYAVVNNGTCDSKITPIALLAEACTNEIEINHEVGVALDLNPFMPGDERAVYITNRWGDLIYAAEDYEMDSNKFTGVNLPQGAYYIYVKNKEEGQLPIPYKGIIYLLK